MEMDFCNKDFYMKPGKKIYLLLGQKGSGKSYIASIMESQFGIKFIQTEDIAKNLLPAHQLGIKTAWIENDDKYCKEGFDGYHVDFRVKNLTKFLEDINKKVA